MTSLNIFLNNPYFLLAKSASSEKSNRAPVNKQTGNPAGSKKDGGKRGKHGWLWILIPILIAAGVGAWYLWQPPVPFIEGEAFLPERSGKVKGGTYTIPVLDIPEDINIQVEDDLILNVTGEVTISGALTGNCVTIQITGRDELTITGTLDNTCSDDQEGESRDLYIYTAGGDFTLGNEDSEAVLNTSGNLLISDESALELWEFDIFPEQRSESSIAPACSATASTLISSIFIDYPAEIEFSGQGVDPDGGKISFSWDFGDGTTSSETEPSHSYTSPGSYPVVLTVQDDEDETCQSTLSVLIQDGEGEEEAVESAGISLEPFELVIQAWEQTFFNAQIFDPMGGEVSYTWNFGDGTTSLATIPSHTYSQEGLYHVSVTVTSTSSWQSTATAVVYVYARQATSAEALSNISLARFEVPQEQNQRLWQIYTKTTAGGNFYMWSSANINFANTQLVTKNGKSDEFHGKPAGDIIIYAPGSITIGQNVLIQAGDGGDGRSNERSGGKGGSGGDVRIFAGGGITIMDNPAGASTSILAGHGGDGGDATGSIAFGGHGGDGGALYIRAYGGNLNVGENVILQVGGNGGEGGSATDTSSQKAWAQGGNGGSPGYFKLSGRKAWFTLVRFILGNGGTGGDAVAEGVAGVAQCPSGGDGGNATATGGRGGNSWGCFSNVIFDADKKSTLIGGNTGKGGDANATAGDGGDSFCNNEALAGDGGNAYANGGRAGEGGRVACVNSNLTFINDPFSAGTGGSAFAQAGAGGEAEASAQNCGQAARALGGNGGKAGAFGGMGGSRSYWQAGDGGDAEAISGKGGDATARGGNCADGCARGGNAKATGGDGGDLFSSRAGDGGLGKSSQKGNTAYTIGLGGDATAAGGQGGACAQCPAGKGGDGGDAQASAGGGGYYSSLSKRGVGGSADATGGNGGSGATCCNPPAEGGAGGKGGDALAENKLYGMSAQQGGNGGNGGIGEPPGKGGAGGSPGGNRGVDAVHCPTPTPTSTRTATSTPSVVEQAVTATPSLVEVVTEQAAAEPENGYPPEIFFVEFPVGTRHDLLSPTEIEIPADGSDIKGLVGFRDVDDSISYVWFEPIQDDTVFEGFGFYITDEDLEEGDFSEGVFSFYIYCNEPSREIFNVQLMDISGNWYSSAALFGFVCR